VNNTTAGSTTPRSMEGIRSRIALVGLVSPLAIVYPDGWWIGLDVDEDSLMIRR
jgi:hypothetical protein